MNPVPHLSWFVETRGVTLVHRDRGVELSIPYPYAGLWALIANGNFELTFATEMMGILLSVARREAAREVRETLEVWRKASLIC